MAVWSEPPTFLNLYGADGLGLLINVRNDTSDLAGRKNAVNWAYKELAGLIKGYWRRRSFDYTASSSPALTAGTRAYNVPASTGAVFDEAGQLYYRSGGRAVEVSLVDDAEWLQRSATRTTDAGYPTYARLFQTASAVQFELNRPMSQTFIDTVGTLTVEYFLALADLSGDTDTTVLPRNRVHLLLPLAGWYYAVSQGDHALADRLKPKAEDSKALIVRHDLTRTGRPRQRRPTYDYTGMRGRMREDGYRSG